MSRLLFALMAAATAATASPQPAGPLGLPALNYAHLDWLRRDVALPAGGTVATWQIYAAPVKKGDRRGPYRFVGDEDEGVGCVDDVARAAIVYARAHARTGDPHAARQARAAFGFIRHMATGKGTYVNFIWGDGRLNADGPTSKPGLNWWTARALWALAEGARAFAERDPAYARELRAQAWVTVKAIESDLAARDGTWRAYGRFVAPGWFLSDAPDVTAVAVIGLATLLQDGDDPLLRRLIARYGAAIAAWAPEATPLVLSGAHMPGLGPTSWHSYGAHMLHALALGGHAIGSPSLLAAARDEADRFVPRLLAMGGPIAGLSPGLMTYPQIAYGGEPMALGLLALQDATGEARYGRLAALFGAWIVGANPVKRPVYDAATGRVWDGIDPKGLSADAGAESTIEALLALQAFADRPALWPTLQARETGGRPVRFFEAESAPGARAVEAGGLSGDRAALLAPGQSLSLPLPPLAGSHRFWAVTWRERFVRGERATLRLDGRALPLTWPPEKAPWAAPEAVGPFGPFVSPPRALTFTHHGGRQPVRLDGVMAVPALVFRRFDTASGPIAVGFNAGERPIPLSAARSAVVLPPGGAFVLEGPAAMEIP